QLEKLRREIQEFENRIAASRSREKGLLDELADYEKEINLRRELIRQLEQESVRAQKTLQGTQRELNLIDVDISRIERDSLLTSAERDSLAALVMRRAVYTYKYLRRDALKAMLMSRSVVQMLTRQKYLKRIADVDRANLERLDRKNHELQAMQQQLLDRKAAKSERLSEYRQIADYKSLMLVEEQSETQLLTKRRSVRAELLQEIKQDQSLLRQQLTEKKLAAQRVENLIRTFEAEREALPERPSVTWVPEVPFKNLKGKMNWPTTGKVVTKFGMQKHQQFATVTENPGIEIEAPEGDPVYAVCTGQVTKITWLRGYGNTIIVDHQDGYYTVYAHLGDIHVREGQVVLAGEALGAVGQTGTLAGPRLHFEIWAKREKQDPLSWLVRK
ncbi:peptidoglycan DD-metalloendopeptidase family protein, partial [bacterium]|nr:peptidoglycan DD-metalloendopeptidase family protein [bacterium]